MTRIMDPKRWRWPTEKRGGLRTGLVTRESLAAFMRWLAAAIFAVAVAWGIAFTFFLD